MEDDLDSARRGVHPLVAAKLTFNDLDFAGELGEIGAVARREVVEHAHVIAAFDERPNEVRAEDLHGSATTW